jgi:nucleoside-triphosphatase THEP1
MPEGVIDPGAAAAGSPPPATPAPAGPRRPGAPGFELPERVPWSALAEEFALTWGRENGRHNPEHIEISGQSGSGKTYFLGTILQQRAAARGSQEILIATKPDDDTIPRLGWPIVDTWRELQRYRQAVYWPRTQKKGDEREKYHEKKIYELLSQLWQPNSNTVVAFDEIGYVEDLSHRIKKMVRMYWREARSGAGITLAAMKQRPVGVVRDQHSESRWKAVFPPADMGDMQRFAELLGHPRDWSPILQDLDQENHEFVLRNSNRRIAYITWVDTDLKPIPAQENQRGRTAREYLFGRPSKAQG